MILYLVLRHHLNIVRTTQTYIVHPEELVDAASSLSIIGDALASRRDSLEGVYRGPIRIIALTFECYSLCSALFQQRRLVVSVEVEDFASGMVSKVAYAHLEAQL